MNDGAKQMEGNNFLSSIWLEAVLHAVWVTFYGLFVLTAYNNLWPIYTAKDRLP